MGLCDVKAHPEPPLFKELLADVIKHKGVAPYGEVYIRVLRASGVDHWVSSKWIRWLGSHKTQELFGNSQLQIPRRKIWIPAVNWGSKKKKKVSKWDEPIQTSLVFWYCPLRFPPPLCLPVTYPFSTHTTSPQAFNSKHYHPLPQTNAIPCSSCFLQVTTVIVRMNKKIQQKMTKKSSKKLLPQRNLKSETQGSVARVQRWMKSWFRTNWRRSQR